MAKESKSKALAIVEAPFTALAIPQEELKDLIHENLGDELGEFDIERIKIPPGGILQWTVPTLEGEPEMVKDLQGVIVYNKLVRAYWVKSIDDGGAASPDCKSDNNAFGEGTPGGSCSKCPFSKFGSAVGKDGNPGKGQACQQKMLVFLLGEEGFLPKIVVLPATSISPLRKYFVRLMDRGISKSSIVTKLKLEEDKNDSGIKYSKVKPVIVGALDDKAKEQIATYIDNLKVTWEAEGIKEDDEEEDKFETAEPDTEE